METTAYRGTRKVPRKEDLGGNSRQSALYSNMICVMILATLLGR
jgi:hypothetical protein